MELEAHTEKAMEQGCYNLAEELARKREALAIDLVKTRIQYPKTGAAVISRKVARLQNQAALRKAQKDIIVAMTRQAEQMESAAMAAGSLVQSLEKIFNNLNEELSNLKVEQNRLKHMSEEDVARQVLELTTTIKSKVTDP